MDTATILAKVGRDAPEPGAIDTRAFGPWFHMMARETTQSDEQLGRRDIGSLNVEAALGLPGAENLDLDASVQQLNAWAAQLRAFTERRWPLFQRSPEEYDFSRGQFLMLVLVTFLQKHLGVHYNESFSEGEYDTTDSRNLFIHGILSGHGGTCATLPVLYIAVGRRLGYPLYLVRAKEHFFARWEEAGGERFNIECTSPGFRAPDDEYYRHWPKPLTHDDLRAGNFLRNLRPREVLAAFLCERTRCLMDHLRLGDALLSSCLAGQLAPEDPGVLGVWCIATLMARSLEEARRRAELNDYWGLDLCKVSVAEANDRFDLWAAPIVRQSLERIARIHASSRAIARDEVFGLHARANGTRRSQVNP
ncbi:MAG: hypothetical protein NTW96_20440 [Planctomycetia bacterium]|nr:hypothetical protein [Planctomycetia bacterium]